MQRTFLWQRLIACLSTLVLAGCAGLKSEVVDRTDKISGVAYYMPLKAFVLTVTKAGDKVTKLDWKESPAIPDLRKTYSLSYHPHWIGKTTIDVSVAANGLLGVTNTTTTDSAAALAKIQPKAFSVAAKTLQESDSCPTDGEFAFFLFEAGRGTVCGVVSYNIEAISVGNKPVDTPRDAGDASAAITQRQSGQGVFYRQNRPYTASASSEAMLATSLLAMPNESPTMYLPFGRTLFAANDGKVTFEDGMLTSYKQSDEGELVALLQFPATIASAYFTAIGNIFTAFSNKDSKDAELKVKELKLDILQAQLAKCKAALDKGDTAALQTLGCASLSAN